MSEATIALVPAEAVAEAARTIRGVAVRTPLLPAEWLSERVGGEVRLKCENLQHMGAFKQRGAYNMVARLSEEQRNAGIITYSSGNHGQATAYAGRAFSVPTVVVMPTDAPDVKVQGCRRLGAEVVFEGTTSIERGRRAKAIADERGLTIIPPFDHPDIIAGQGTAGLEILEDWPAVDTVLVPIGGGGLISGIAAWVKRTRPACRVIGVEPEGAAAMRASLDAGQPVTLDGVDTIADGLKPTRPGDLTFHHVNELVDDVVTVSDTAIREATALLFARSHLVVEFSGAATVAALLAGAWSGQAARTAAVLSGGNLDPSLVPSVLSSLPVD